MTPGFYTALASAQYVGLFAMFVLALFRGGAPEKLVTGICTLLMVVQIHYRQTGNYFVGVIDIGYFILDGTMLVALGAVALRANRVYPLFIAAAQLIATLAYVLALFPIGASRDVHQIMAVYPSLVQFFVITIGLGHHVLRTARWGTCRDWRSAHVVASR